MLKIDAEGYLIIPMFDDANVLRSIQRISGRRDRTGGFKKRFLKGISTKELSCPIGKPENSDRILICEGYATANALHASEPSACVVAAFSATNLRPVARNVRSMYPGADLIICADNDVGERSNIGVERA